MRDLLAESTVGRVLHVASRGKIFKTVEERDPSLLHPYEKSKLALTPSASRSPLERVTSSGSIFSRQISRGEEKEKPHDYDLVEFTEGDPENPRNWSLGKKVFVTFQICLLTTSVYIGSAIYTAGLVDVTLDFGVSETVALLGLTLFVLGYALGPMVLASLSEVPFFGRGPIYIVTLAMFVLLNLGVIFAKNIGMLLAFRFITGFIGSPVLATGGASIADMYQPKKQVYGIAVWGIAAVLGPAMGPVVGGFAAQANGWRWPIWELFWLSSFCLLFLTFFLPETSSANILYRRAGRFRKATGNTNLRAQSEIDAEGMTGAEITQMILVRPFTLTFTEPICFFLNMYIALIYALLYLWFESFPLVFINIYHFTEGTLGLAFIGILMGAFVVIGPFFWWIHKYLEPKFDLPGGMKPEQWLKPAFVGGFFIPVCLFWFGWSSRESVHWIVPIIGSGLFTIGAFLLFMSVLSYLGDAYPAYVASVYAGNDLFRSCFGAGFPLFANAMYTKLGIGGASSLLGGLSICFIPIPFILYRYGAQIRRRSKMCRHDEPISSDSNDAA